MKKMRGDGSFALVSTLLVVAVMALGGLAFFQAARMDRLVTRNTADRVRAELAAESGLAAAQGLLRTMTANDHFLIVLNSTNRQLFAGNGSNQPTGSLAYQPLFSGVSNLAGLVTNLVNNLMPSFSNAVATNLFTNTLPGGFTVTSPAVAWVNITNATGRTNARFVFWVEDLSGRLDLSVAGAIGTNARRPTGTNPAELALWSLFNPGVTNDLSNSVVLALTNARSALLTPASARLVTSAVTTNLLADLAARLVHPSEVEVIPYGFGYVDAGRPKFNINDYIGTTNVIGLAGVISSNLPNFAAGRRGGFPGTEDYVRTLAASAIDYADANSTPTVGSGYRGVDSTPFVTILYNQYDWYQRGATNIRLRLATYVQLWNLSDRAVSGDFTIIQTNRDTIQQLGWSPGITTQSTNIANFNPNEVRVINFMVDTNISTGVFGITNTSLNIPANTQYTFTTLWNGSVCDQTRVPGERIAKTIQLQPTSGGPDWSGFMPGLRYLPYTTVLTNQQCGDPRATYYLAATLAANDFDIRSSWGGMAVMRPAAGRYQTRPWLWADPVTNDAVSVPAPTALVSLSTRITNISQLTNGSSSGLTNYAPQKINNSGSYQRITELGNIYDPAQWIYSNYPSSSIPTTATPNSSYGGGISLRIGKAEHPRFTNDGTRASQILDLFAAGPAGGGGGVTNFVAGKINLNTATTNTLRALAAGVFHTNDPTLVSSSGNGTNFVVPVVAISNFIGAVTNFRGQRPFLSTSQLNDITLGGGTYPSNSVFGNPTFGTGSNQVVSQWHDAAAEEWFSKIYPLATVRSRNFLVHVVGQAMSINTNGPARPLASSRKLFQIYVSPVRGTNGLTTNVNIQIVGAWSL